MKRDLGDDEVYAEYEAVRDFVHEREAQVSQQQAEANQELYVDLVRILHDCLMRGVENDDVDILIFQCGVDRRDVYRYTIPVLKRSDA